MSAYFALNNFYRSKEMGKFVQWLLRVMEYILHCGISTFKNLSNSSIAVKVACWNIGRTILTSYANSHLWKTLKSICFLVFKTAFIPFTFDD